MTAAFRKANVRVHLDAIAENTAALRSSCGSDEFFCPMIKANAYGHGDVAVARVLMDNAVTTVGVALVEEGLRLRQAGVDAVEVLVFGPWSGTAARAMIDARLTPVVSHWRGLEDLAAAAGDRVPFHLKFDTGMHRLGFSPDEAEPLRDWLLHHGGALRLVGLGTHLFAAEDALDPAGQTERQLQLWHEIVRHFDRGEPLQSHCLNSAGLLARSGAAPGTALAIAQGARPGIALYGVAPDLTAVDLARDLPRRLRPALELTTEIVSLHRIPTGQGVSYGWRWRATRPTRVGVMALGYADGYLRAFSNRGTVLVAGREVPVIGTVCMDYTMLDLTDLSESDEQLLGATIVVLGGSQGLEQTAEKLARQADTIPYELLTAISGRVHRL